MCYAIIHHLILKTILEPTNQNMSTFFFIIFLCPLTAQIIVMLIRNFFHISEGQNLDLLRQTLQWLATMKQASGNYPVVYLDFKWWWIFDPPLMARCCNRFLFPPDFVNWCKFLRIRMSFLVVMSQNLEEQKRHVSTPPMAFSRIHEMSCILILWCILGSQQIHHLVG